MKTHRNGDVRNFHCFRGGKTTPITTTKTYSIVLADDHAMFRRGIKRIIEESPNLKVVGEAADGCEVLDLLKGCMPDLVILDISMPRCGGLEASREIRKLYPGLKVMFLTMHRNEEYMQRAMSQGVDGYLLKENAADDLLEAIFTLMEGKTYFSPIYSQFKPSDPMVMTRLAGEVAF